MDYFIDATNQKLGRLASEIAVILQGKKSAFYNPRLAGSGKVIVTNVDKLDIAEKKAVQKIYYRHTGYMGHLKKRTLKEYMQKSPAAVLRLAVARMLPKNFIRAKRLKRLIIK
jgi:large subunit ribosomal protein L13